MDCFTVTDRVQRGIEPVTIEVDDHIQMAIPVGDKYVLLETEWARRIMNLDEQALKVLKKKDIPLPALMRADVQFGSRFCDNRVVKETPTDKSKNHALVLAQVPPGDGMGGSIGYTAAVNGPEEEEDGRVRRSYRPLDEALGVRLVMLAGVEMLVTMTLRSASFRAQRTGDLGNRPPYYFVNWEPPRLYINSPKRFRNLGQQAA